MIKILICFSVVNDMDGVIRTDWEKAFVKDFNIDYTQKIIDPYDEAAIEYALKYKEAAGRSGTAVHLTAVTIGDSLKETIYKNLFAVGVDRIVLLKSGDPITFDPDITAKILTEFATDNSFDAVFLGQQNSITCNGQTGVRLSVYLGFPYVGYISDIQFIKDRLRVKCKTRFGFQSATVGPKAIFSFYNAEHPFLRMATLREKLGVAKNQIEIYSVITAAARDEELCPESISYQPMVRKCNMITGRSADEKALLLLERYLQSKGE